MISKSNGEVRFRDGLLFKPQTVLAAEHLRESKAAVPLTVKGWWKHEFGRRLSEHGEFEVAGVCDEGNRVRLVLLLHLHAFYEADTPEDADRRAYNEGVINTDLAGQREFWWGQAQSHLDWRTNKQWLIVVYDPGALIPKPGERSLDWLHERAPL